MVLALPITSFTAGLSGVMLLGLLVNVVSMRRSEKIGLGSGDNKLLELRIRG